MVPQVLAGLNPGSEGIFVDCTVGGGGHAHALLNSTGEKVCLIGLDQDPAALAAADARLAGFDGRYTLVRANFSQLADVLKSMQLTAVDGFLFDLGVSSYQLDQPTRGFSYMQDGPLDMRMDQDQPVSAQDLVNQLSARELTGIIKDYGEERWASRIASFIVRRRADGPITTTGQLVEIIKQAIPAAARREGPHPAKRTFQALRIAVNNELDIIANSLTAAVMLLKPGGRICVITFHSLEDRIVKETWRKLAYPCQCPPGFPVCNCGQKPLITLVRRRPVLPSEQEVAANPRARSAKLRIVEKLACSK